MGNSTKLHAVLLEDSSSEEITLRIKCTESLKMYQMLNKLKIEMIATTELVSSSEFYHFIWINDVGNRLRNAIASGLLGDSQLVTKSKGKRKICQKNILSSYQLRTE